MPKGIPGHSNNPATNAGQFPTANAQPLMLCPHCDRQLLEYPPIDRLVSIEQAASFYGVHPGTIRNWIDKGWIRLYKISEASKVLRVPLADLLRLAERFGSKDPITRAKGKVWKHSLRPQKSMKDEEDDSQTLDNR